MTRASEILHTRTHACEALEFRISSAFLFFSRKEQVQPELHPDRSVLVQGRDWQKQTQPCAPSANPPGGTVIYLECFCELYYFTSESQILYLDGCRATWQIPPPGDPAWTG